ncbi:MAG: aminoacyl-tRNA hydrolase [Chloroflexi bacterium]|nr:aminoacyl-tRNA hydrolase [Chloroflexota bacterium]
MLKFLHRTQNESTLESGLYLLVGLGNPGVEYRNSRHNIGFMVIGSLAKYLGITLGRMQSKALVGQGSHDGRKIILAKPQTYMNLSGQAVSSLVRFYKLPLSQLLVIHDDMDLPFGVIRLRPGGGSGGQKGLGSVINSLVTEEFPRLRVGIGHPTGQMNAVDYVLQPFSSAEQEMLPAILDHAREAALTFVSTGLETAMNQYNGEVFK